MQSIGLVSPDRVPLPDPPTAKRDALRTQARIINDAAEALKAYGGSISSEAAHDYAKTLLTTPALKPMWMGVDVGGPGSYTTTTASTTTAPVSLAEMERTIKEIRSVAGIDGFEYEAPTDDISTYDTIMSSISSAPSWTRTSLEWIKARHPSYYNGASTPRESLKRSLRRMDFDNLTGASKTMTKKEYDTLLEVIVDSWNQDSHDKLREHMASVTSRPPAMPDALVTALPVPEVEPPPAPLTVEDELAEIAAQAERADDPRFGSW